MFWLEYDMMIDEHHQRYTYIHVLTLNIYMGFIYAICRLYDILSSMFISGGEGRRQREPTLTACLLTSG